jgi:hypothetical protein
MLLPFPEGNRQSLSNRRRRWGIGLRGTWRFKHHLAVVAITHDDRRFSIRYEDSRNLLHSGDQIHHNYNGLVSRLAAWIQREPVRPSLEGAPE